MFSSFVTLKQSSSLLLKAFRVRHFSPSLRIHSNQPLYPRFHLSHIAFAPNMSTLNSGDSVYNHSSLPSSFIGLNTIDVAPESNVKAYIKSHGGHTVISSVSMLDLNVRLFSNRLVGPHCKQRYCRR